MFNSEARWIAREISRLDLPLGSVCLNIGSSTRHFRQVEQPFIQTDLIAPLEARGLRFVHCDMKAEEGVDLVADVLSDAGAAALQRQSAQVLLASNLLEHLTHPAEFCAHLRRLLPKGGYAVISVPFSYPLHRDPIDTLFRPSPEEIARITPGFTLVKSEVVSDQTFLQETLAKPRPALRLAKHFLQCLLPFYRPAKWQERVHSLLWLWRPYKVSIAVLRAA